MIFDADLEADCLPAWDFQLMYKGQLRPVAMPDARQTNLICDAGNAPTRLAAYTILATVFSELTGIPPLEVAEIDNEVICSFVDSLGVEVQKRLTVKKGIRILNHLADAAVRSRKLCN